MSTPQILINHPGDGDWIMSRVGGLFNETTDHCIALHRDRITYKDGVPWVEMEIRGGVVYTGFLHASIMLHMAGSEDNWATRDFLWMVFDYAFNQLGVRKLVGLVPSNNTRAISVDLRLGFRLEGRLTEMLADPHEDLLILTMLKKDCKWLKVTPRYYRSNQWVN